MIVPTRERKSKSLSLSQLLEEILIVPTIEREKKICNSQKCRERAKYFRFYDGPNYRERERVKVLCRPERESVSFMVPTIKISKFYDGPFCRDREKM